MRTVLIVDDEYAMRKKYKKVLKAVGIDVLEAADAIEVADALMRDRSRIDLIVLDIQIPEIDGRDIFDVINEYTPNLDIIISSVIPVKDQKLRIPRAVDYFNKADSDATFLNKVRNALGVVEVK